MRKITCWYRYNNKDNKESFRFHHCSLGWSGNNHPIGNSTQTTQWANNIWQKRYGYLIDNKVVEIPYFEEIK